MAVKGRQFVVNLITETKDAKKGLDDFTKKFDSFKVPVLAGLAAVAAAFAAITAAIYRSVTALIELGTEFNDAYRTIQAGTGATGQELDRLEQSFRNVFSTGSDSMEDVASAMAELDSRFDTLSNRRLERLTTQFLNLGGLLGEDTVGLVQSLTAAFNRFDVPAHMASETLDTLFRISQETGYSLGQLGSQTENYGVGLQRLGFDINEAAAFLALLEREGVSASRIFPSLNTAAGRLAQEGVGDIQTALAEAIEELRTLDQAAAEARAYELLGADFGNFLEVVRGGKIDIDLFLQSLGDPTGAINSTAEQTDGLRERWDTFKNYLKTEFEPVAMTLFDELEGAVSELIPAADRVKEAYGEGGLASALEQVQEEWTNIYETYLEPLWLRFLTFLHEVIVPAAIDLGGRIGRGLFNAMIQAIYEGMTNLGFRDVIRMMPFNPIAQALDAIMGTGGVVDFTEQEISNRVVYIPGRGYVLRSDLQTPATAIPGLASGGVVTSPTLALIGEAGPEAVIPLSEMNEYGGQTVNVYVSSADPQAVVDAIRRYTRANGPLGQVVSV